jgi:hypothetical protein
MIVALWWLLAVFYRVFSISSRLETYSFTNIAATGDILAGDASISPSCRCPTVDFIVPVANTAQVEEDIEQRYSWAVSRAIRPCNFGD